MSLYLAIYLLYQQLKICSVNLKGGLHMVLWIKSEQCEMPQKTYEILVKVFYRIIKCRAGGIKMYQKLRGESNN